MRCFSFFVLFVVFHLSTVSSQETQNPESYWELLFNNQRKEALAKFEKKKKSDISDQLIHEILKAENATFSNPDRFIEHISSYPDFEYYLYALWNQNFFFDTYLTTGFNKKNSENINAVDLNLVNDPTVKESIRYLKSAVAQHHNDWQTYYRINNEIPAIKAWQFCGSFENLNGSGLATEYGPEKMAFSKADFNANSNGLINWYSLEGRDQEAYQYYSNHSEYGSGVNYAQTFISNPKERKAVIRFGSSSLAKIWLNDVLIYENANDGISDLDAYSIAVNLPQGHSRLLVKNADVSGIAYFIVRITDLEGHAINDLKFSKSNVEYAKSSYTSLRPEVLTHPVEAFFVNKLLERPNDFFSTFCLINSYLRNSKYTEAKALLLPLIDSYPKSSFLRKYLIECYRKEKDFTSAKEVQTNIENSDKDYYLSYLYRFQDSRELFKLPLAEFETFMTKFSTLTDMKILKQSAALFTGLRKEDKKAVKESLKNITEEHKDQLDILKVYLNIYSSYLKEDDKAIGILQDINRNYFDYSALKSLAQFYDKQNQKEKALKLFADRYDLLKNDNIFIADFVAYLHNAKKYAESLPYIDQLLANYPFSFVGLELKGKALEQLDRPTEALKWYEKSLRHNGENTALRKKIEDLSKARNYFEELVTENIYEFIAQNRNRGTANNYGYNYLLDENLLQLYPEGGGRSQTRYVVEITSDKGIEALKEVNLGLSGSYHISKSEIVKPDKKLVPASKSGSNLVFNNLEIGDIIYVDYESSYSTSGRFYKDHVDYFQFDSYHPIFKNTLKILVPKGKPFTYKVLNGEIPYKTRTIDNYVYHEWQAIDEKVMAPQENFMPSLSDISRYVHISTIASWNDIANWYSDLVRPQFTVNSDVKAAFETIFPNGTQAFSEDERASRIYYYIMENFSYSHVGFRQSGYVPQKPSKTIKSKLGDCKDFSTLYVTLAQMAGLEAHLVLVLTSDYGESSMVLPSQDFNHCIAKVFIDGKGQYLELTDNNMPYKAIPTTLENATALDIPNQWVTKVDQGVYKLSDIAHVPTVLESNIKYVIGEDRHHLKIESVLKGSIISHYSGILKEQNREVIEKAITDDFRARITEDFKLDSVYAIKYNLRSPVIEYTTDLTVTEKMDEIGRMKVFRIPAVNNAYNTSIIEDSDRNFPIDYLLYENADDYKSSYEIQLNEDERFVEVPENVQYSYKNHLFTMTYDLKKENQLYITIGAQTSKNRIAASEYPEFKSFVKSVLDAKQQLIGYKKRSKDVDVSLTGKK